MRDFISGFFILLENQIRTGDVDNVIRVMQATEEELIKDPEYKDRIIEPLEIFGLDQFGDSAIVIKARLKTIPIEQWTIGREYRKRLKKAFDAEGIEIPFPHTTVYWGEEIKPLELNIKNHKINTLI